MGQPDAELRAVAELAADIEYTEVERILRSHGWTTAGVGDWATVLRSPSHRWAARISPFDPTAPYSAELYRIAADTGQVPALALHRTLPGGAELTVLEHLCPVAPAEAAEVHRALADQVPELTALADDIREVHQRALRELPWCGPLDDNPDNVMRAVDGRLVVIDVFYADGPALYAAARDDPDRVVRSIPAECRRHLTEIPVAASGPWSADDRERMRRGLAEADARANSS